MIVYFDTSAFLKLLLEEPGADEAAGLWRSADLSITGRITFPEARAALAAAMRSGRLSEEGYRSILGLLQRRWRELHVVELDEGLGETAGDLAERHALRALDAVHLASALAGGRRVVVATWDDRLAEAARSAGLSVAP